MSAHLELRQLRCIRGERVLFDGVSASIGAGWLLRVDGVNGAGKTSLLRMICGLSMPAEGGVFWQGQPVASLRDELNRQLVYIGHAPALKDELSAAENLRAACRLGGRDCTDADAVDALALAGLRGRERLPARALSQGQRKRAALARLALGAGLALWVLDEPFNALDDAASVWLQGMLAAHLARGGIVILTSHERRAWEAALPRVDVMLQSPTLQPEAVE